MITSSLTLVTDVTLLQDINDLQQELYLIQEQNKLYYWKEWIQDDMFCAKWLENYFERQ